MQAAVYTGKSRHLIVQEVKTPLPGSGEIRLKVSACGLCRTDLHIVDGELHPPRIPLIPGHQIVGRIDALGSGVTEFSLGQRVGVPWLGGTCGTCTYCTTGQENLCDHATFTGFSRDGGFAEQAVCNARFAFPLPESFPDLAVAPLLCGGLIGYRALRMCGSAQRIGFYGFGSSAHILCQIAVHQHQEVFAFVRKGDLDAAQLALQLGAHWAGDSTQKSPKPLDAAIIFAPLGELVPLALQQIRKGGKVVCAGIHMSEIPAFSYDLLWGERTLQSVANLTRQDGEELLALAAQIPVKTAVTSYPLSEVNTALDDLRSGTLTGSAVIDLNPAS